MVQALTIARPVTHTSLIRTTKVAIGLVATVTSALRTPTAAQVRCARTISVSPGPRATHRAKHAVVLVQTTVNHATQLEHTHTIGPA